MISELITKIFGYISTPLNYILDLLPYYWMRPLGILAIAYVLATFTRGRIDKFKLFRVILITSIWILALLQIGVR